MHTNISITRLFNLAAVALEVALVWALFHGAFRSTEPDVPPLCTAHTCVAASETSQPRIFS